MISNFTEKPQTDYVPGMADLQPGLFGIRCFRVTWNNRKVLTSDPQREDEQTSLGVIFPDGYTSLNTGQGFRSFSEMKDFLSKYGPCQIEEGE